MKWRVVGFIVAALLLACGTDALLGPRPWAANTDASVAGTYVTYPDQRYGLGVHNLVDVFVPTTATAAKPVGVVFWFHGNGWGNGVKYLPVGAYQFKLPVNRSLALASCDYRGETTAVFPASLRDVERCMRYVLQNASKYHLKPQAFGVWGASHGGFLASWVLVNCGDTLNLMGNKGLCPKAAISLFGAPDLLHFMSDLRANQSQNGCAPPDTTRSVIPTDTVLLKLGSSLLRVRSGLAPSQHLHGDHDCITPWQGSMRMDAALRAAGNASTYRLSPGFTHGGPQWKDDATVIPQLQFFQQYVK